MGRQRRPGRYQSVEQVIIEGSKADLESVKRYQAIYQKINGGTSEPEAKAE